MKLSYVKTSNHTKFMGGIESISKVAKEARIMLLSGEPGVGKTRTVDNFGAFNNAIYIEGLPGMTLGYTKDLIAYELGGQGLKGFALQRHIQDSLQQTKQPIVLDEAQHGLDKKAAVIEYLRRIVEQSGGLLVLVCHTTEKHRFAEHKLAHIATRISAVIDFKPADLTDCQLYFKELCDIKIDEGIAKRVLEQSRGRYRLMASAIATVESVASVLKKDSLVLDDIKGFKLCEDAMRTLNKGGAK